MIESAPHAEEAPLARLTALIARQRRQIERLRREAASRSVLDLARGRLMERLDCSAAEASAELARIAKAAGTEPADLAAELVGLAPWLPLSLSEQSKRPLRPDAGLPGQQAGAAGLAAAVLEEALAPSGAVAVAIWTIAPDGGLELAGEAGFGASEASRWQRLPPGIGAPAQLAAQRDIEVWWPRGRPARVRTPLIGRWDTGARAVVPISISGFVTGSLEVCWPDAITEFEPSLRRQVTSIADLCAQALGEHRPRGGAASHPDSWVYGLLDVLQESALCGRAIRNNSGDIIDFQIQWTSRGFRDPAGRPARELRGQSLLEAYPVAAQRDHIFDKALAVMVTGDACQVLAHLGNGALAEGIVAPSNVRIAPLFDGIVITWQHAGDAERLAALLEHTQRLGQIGAWEESMTTGSVHWTGATYALFGISANEPVRMSDLHLQVLAEDFSAVDSFRDRLLTDKAAAATTFRIIRGDDQSVRQIRAFAEPVLDQSGALIAVRGAYQDASSRYHTEIALAATRDRLSDTEKRAEEEHRLAIRLQQAITPLSSHMAAPAALDIAARYRPAGRGHLVGGDWYDTLLLPDQKVMLVVGDVVGHGIGAVTGMVALRNSLRGLAFTGAGPGTLLGWLNTAATHLSEAVLGTAACGIFEPADRTLRWASAGHLPPILVRSGSARQLQPPEGLLLGVDADADYQEATTRLQAKDTLLLFTDGLIERRDASIDTCLSELIGVASTRIDDIDAFADRLLAMASSDTSDDACLVALRVR